MPRELLLRASLLGGMAVALIYAQSASPIVIDYPANESIFPPDMAAPTFLWRDPTPSAVSWRIDVSFADGSPAIHVTSKGEPMRIGEIDPRCVGPTNRLPSLTPEQAVAHTWMPDAADWAAIKKRTVAATVTISGYAGDGAQPVSRGQMLLRTSVDPVGAPIFYRDVPLMPSKSQAGVIKPLDTNSIPLIAWRLRDVSETRSRVLLTDMHTCANCHSFSDDGSTLGMDLDGPANDKSLYTLAPVGPVMTIRNEDVISWTSFRGQLGAQLRVGFMSRVSPDGRRVVTTIKPPGSDKSQLYYVSNFTDYRFLQVFYPTRGILVWYDRASRKLQPLPGADDPRYVQTNAVWSPDGKCLVFARAEAKDPYRPDGKMAAYANDPLEVPIQYDLYRIPFNDGKGGKAQPIAGASRNGMSNSFPKISPDGRWIVFVQARNGLLMRPDSQLYIVPAEGGEARRMNCNTPLMNSWHSFSPNGRWLVFSSKSRSPYTQMFLTHIDAEGRDSPAILIENSTAANRAVNIPEFVNVRPPGIDRIDVPAADFYRQFDVAATLTQKGDFAAAILEWTKALAMGTEDARARNDFGASLAGAGRIDDAIAQYRKALELQPDYPEAHSNLGKALAGSGRVDEAIVEYRQALEAEPSAEAHYNLGVTLAKAGRTGDAITQYQRALQLKPAYAEAHDNLGNELARAGRLDEAVSHYRQALEADPSSAEAHNNLGRAFTEQKRLPDAIAQLEAALAIRPNYAEAHNNLGIALAASGRLEDAVAHYRKAIEIEPAYGNAHNNLGAALAREGKLDDAVAEFRKALELSPASAMAEANLGHALLARKNAAEARTHLERALKTSPNLVEARYDLGAALMVGGRRSEALANWRQVLRESPDHLRTLNDLAWALATCPDAALRNGAEAVALAERAVGLTPGNDPALLATLAAAYAEAGRFDKAVETENRAVALAAQQGNATIAATLRDRLTELQAKVPIRQP